MSWYIAPAFVPVKYIPASRKDEIRAKPVYFVHAAAHPKVPGPYNGGFTNHWCLYLQTGNDESVRIDVQPNPQQVATTIPGGFKADILVSLIPYPISTNVIHHKTMGVPAGLVVAHVVDYLLQYGRDKYEFTAEGVGCRKWMIETLVLLTEKEWLDGRAVIPDIAKLWPEETPLEIGGGGYYS